MWGLFGPIQFRTKRGTRVTLVAGFLTIPLTGWSVYTLYEALRRDETQKPRVDTERRTSAGVQETAGGGGIVEESEW